MKLRIISKPHWLHDRVYYVQRWYGWGGIGVWLGPELPSIGHSTESEAKRFAEEYAKGSWVSDTAEFD